MLPIDAILPDFVATLKSHRRAVLQAPPGAGKTTRVPLAILEAGLCNGRIIMLEPRRLAARAAAGRMAETLGEETGQRIGYRIRGDTRISKDTRIEVVTEGILTRMIQSDPELPGIDAVIFDEFHERSLNADLGLALCLEITETLREDLMLVVMSATLDAAPVATIMKAPILTSQGRSYDVTPNWLDRPLDKSQKFETAMADLIETALAKAPGSLLAFLPGEGEIRRTEAILNGRLSENCDVKPLFGAMDLKAQRHAIRPAVADRRNVVLATAIAETSLTLPDIRIVVDGGRSRRALFDPDSGMSRLVTERVTRAEATQRAGRAGRVAAGVCYKLWTKGEDGSLAAFPPPEIASGDLTAFALELAIWGTAPDDMCFVTPPHAGRLEEAHAVLRMLGALDAANRVTEHGRSLASKPLHPRLAHMLECGGRQAPIMAALLSERDPLQGQGVDLALRLRALKTPQAFQGALNQASASRIRQEARRLTRAGRDNVDLSIGAMAALAYPDRIGLRRKGDAPRYLLSGGKGAILPEGDVLQLQRLIVATDLDGDAREARVRQAASLAESELRSLFKDQITWVNVCVWSRRQTRVLSRCQEQFGALVLDERIWRDVPQERVAQAMLEGVRHMGLQPGKTAARFLARVRMMPQDFADFSEVHLMETLETWLLPHLSGVRTAQDWKEFNPLPALLARLDWHARQTLDEVVPEHFVTPLGRKVAIDYTDGLPAIAVRLQEMFGVTHHPQVGGRALQITLLSPAHRPVQVTQDLPRFWATSYADVRKDMRGQYPKHPWPEDPTLEDPTLRAKRRSR